MAKKVLDVPYYTQPTSNTCQATCLKMMAEYLDAYLGQPIQRREIHIIKDTINGDPDRPDQVHANSYANMKWWLENQFLGYISFEFDSSTNNRIALQTVVDSLESDFPVIVSTNHMRTSGHVILVVGYRAGKGSGLGPQPLTTSSAVFLCHDPYGEFDPQVAGKRYGARRYEGGQSLLGGGEEAAGRLVEYDLDGVKRIRADKHSPNTFFMLRGNRGVTGSYSN